MHSCMAGCMVILLKNGKLRFTKRIMHAIIGFKGINVFLYTFA